MGEKIKEKEKEIKIEDKKSIKKENKDKIVLKGMGIVALFIVAVLIVLTLFPVIIRLSTPEGQVEFKSYVDKLGFSGMLILFLLQFAQIFFVVLPGEPLEFLAGMCYGSIGGMLVIFASVFIISTIIVVLVKSLGHKFVYKVWKEEKIKKIENSRVFKDKKKIQMLLFVLFLIPGTPKDLLTYVGALLPINAFWFILIATFARFPSIITSTMAGANMANGNFKTMAIVYILTAILSILAAYSVSKVDATTKEAIDVINEKNNI